MMKNARSAFWIFASILPLTAAGYGCSGSTDVRTPTTAEARGTLTQAQSCADLEEMLKADAVAKMNAQIDAIIADIEENGEYWGSPDYGWEDSPGGVVGSTGSGVPSDPGGAGGSGGGSSGSGGSSGGGDGNGAPPDHSETNTQVAGVDEADILKTDGNYIYLLHGQNLEILKSWPVSDLAIDTTTSIEGSPIEMFVTDDQLVIYSQVDGTSLYQQAGVEPRSPYYDYYGGGAMYDGYYNPYYAPLTKITVLGLDGGQTTGVQKEVYFEGNYASSRRVGKHVRTVLSGGHHGPSVSYYPEFPEGDYPESASEWIDAFEDLRFKNALAIYGSTINDWLPYRFEKSGGNVSALPPSCSSYYVPTAGSTAYGLTQVQSFALDNLGAPLVETSIVGGADTVYSSEDGLYLAARGWNDSMWWGGQDMPLVATDTTETFVHKFDLATNPAQPAYVATGSVPGHVKNQFSLDEKDGLLRIATTRNLASQTDWTSSSSVYVLQQNEAQLVQLGAVTDLAPGEQIYSTRFIGNRGYVVTFRQVDPLFVIDLANPAAPKVLAELKIPGFSEYMHPIDDNHLLTIGQDATNDGQVTGLALQVFDVTNPTAPALMHKYTFSGAESGYSEAQYNHKAFNWYGPKNLLAFPFSGWNPNTGEMKSSLELFDVTLDNGIVKRGSVDHSQFFSADPYGYCGGYFGVGVRRGVFIDDYVYAISYGGVTASDVNTPATPVASVALPQPNQPYGYCGGF
ncbi:beta-propeller domain-containing protein [Polyangium spumosum]|uniref:Beta-propeller domain-containing protein n=1 Tax=Polyangium spumosum TaxID=889282 RepID=A0A6N7Q244_9BACT|nr:beta-propeller domain-containing protein [Polyangium spumosum]MRG96880.1 hypothetical protein [Polyangium spumosum]